jgi:hypothetical protein
VSRGAWGEENSWEGSGSPPVADSSSGDSQKATSTPCATMELGRTWAKVRHSARQASVRSSPFQQAGILTPAAVQPGHAPRDAWYRMGHSKLRWVRPGYAKLMGQLQPLVKDGIFKPILEPTMRAETGFPRKLPGGRWAWLGWRACWRGAAGGGGGVGNAGKAGGAGGAGGT